MTLHEEGIYYLYNFVPNNFKECDLDLKMSKYRDLDILIQNLYVETGTLLFYFVHLEVVFPEIQIYFKMLE